MSDSLLAAWLAGGKSLLDRLPPPPEPPVELFPGPPTEPPLPPEFLPPAPGDEPVIRFPVIEEAARDLAARQVVTRPVFDQLAADAKRAAFTVARVGSEDMLAKVQQALVEDVAEGGTLRQFREKIADVIDTSALSKGHVEGIFRTNVSIAYAKGQDAISQHPLVATEFPYRKETSVNDSRRTPLCKAISKAGLDGTGVFRADDPVWLHFRSPRHWQCRCVTTLLSIEGAAKLGVKEAQEWLRTGLPPTFPAWVPWPDVALPAGWVSPFGAGGPIGLSLGDTDMALRLWDGGRLRGVLNDATGEVFLRHPRTGEVRLGYDPDEKRDEAGKWTAETGKESRTVDVKVEGSPVSVEVNPTLQILKRWLSSPMMSSGGNTRPGRQLKAIVTDGGELYAWEALNENDEDLHHNDVAKAVGVGKHVPFEQRFEIHLQDGEPVFVTHSGVESSPKIARAAKELGAVALSFLGTRLPGAVSNNP